MAKTNSIVGILKLKCPKCREGNLFLNKSSYQVKGFFNMPNNCPKCGQDFQIETGFYYGAMFISYILTGWIALIIVGGCMYFLDFSVNQAFLVLIVVAILSYFFVLRLSRSVWIHIAVKYDKDRDKELDKK